MASDVSVQRSRTITWSDPSATAAAAVSMSGREFLRSVQRGDAPPPPIAALMGFDRMEVPEPGRALLVEPAEYHCNPVGVIHGGLTSALLDATMSVALQSALPAGIGFTTVELKINFIRTVWPNAGRIQCEGTLIHHGKKTAVGEGRVHDTNDKLTAHATTSWILFEIAEVFRTR